MPSPIPPASESQMRYVRDLAVRCDSSLERTRQEYGVGLRASRFGHRTLSGADASFLIEKLEARLGYATAPGGR